MLFEEKKKCFTQNMLQSPIIEFKSINKDMHFDGSKNINNNKLHSLVFLFIQEISTDLFICFDFVHRSLSFDFGFIYTN